MVLRVGIVGGGVVGGGVYELLADQQSRFGEIEVVKLCVKDKSKPRDFSVLPTTELVDDFKEILEDESIQLVVEVMGGTTAAREVIFGAVSLGKHVVTANKAVIATYMTELEALLREQPGVLFYYEAAVCGGVPIVSSMQTDFSADSVREICGIINGTTNYMLHKMQTENVAYSECLVQAQVSLIFLIVSSLSVVCLRLSAMQRRTPPLM
jgi:homoserine dehydrogenase